MNREDFLKHLIESKYGNVKAFSEAINIPYTTVRSILERGVGKAQVDNIIKICNGLGISPEQLSDDLVLNEVISQTLSRMIILKPDRQTKVYEFTEQQLEEQNKIVELPSREKRLEVLAAHIDDDTTEEEMDEIKAFIDSLRDDD